MSSEEKPGLHWSEATDTTTVPQIFKDRTVRKMFDLETEKFYTTDEVAAKLNVDKEVIRDLIRKEELFAIKIGKAYRITESDIQDFLYERYTRVNRGDKKEKP